MKTYISFLRGINVGGKNSVQMKSLKQVYEDLGFVNVKTYIQSGNVIFQSENLSEDDLEQIISLEIENCFAIQSRVFVRKETQIKTILEKNPFFSADQPEIGHLYITFLAAIPAEDFLNKLRGEPEGADKYAIDGRTIYLFCPGGYGRTRLNNNFFEHKLRVQATTRNLKTMIELYHIAALPEYLDQ